MTKHHCMVEQTVDCQSIFNALAPLNLSNITVMQKIVGSTDEAEDEMETWHVGRTYLHICFGKTLMEFCDILDLHFKHVACNIWCSFQVKVFHNV